MFRVCYQTSYRPTDDDENQNWSKFILLLIPRITETFVIDLKKMLEGAVDIFHRLPSTQLIREIFIEKYLKAYYHSVASQDSQSNTPVNRVALSRRPNQDFRQDTKVLCSQEMVTEGVDSRAQRSEAERGSSNRKPWILPQSDAIDLDSEKQSEHSRNQKSSETGLGNSDDEAQLKYSKVDPGTLTLNNLARRRLRKNYDEEIVPQSENMST
jgi:hypothetical protein